MSDPRISLKEYIDVRFDAMRDVERRIDERLIERDRAFEKAQQVLDEKLQELYRWREQIIATRVTRDLLDLKLSNIDTEMDLLKRAVTLSSGKDTGVSRVWSSAGIALSVFAACISAITGAGVFFLGMHK